MCRPSSPRGFILPTTLLVMALLTVMLTAAFVLVSAEHRASSNALASTRALMIAQAGLQRYLSRATTVASGATYDSVTSYTLPGGYATVAASRLVPAAGSQQALWVVRSYGYATSGLLSGEVQARRAVAQLAIFNPGTLPAHAALVSINANEVRPWLDAVWGAVYPNPVSGIDACAGGTDTVGLVHAAGDYTSSPAGPAPERGTTVLTSRTEVYDSTHIDWPSLLAGNFTPDYDVSSGSFPGAPSGWPIYYASGNLTIAGSHDGVLVVRGNLTMSFGATWNGVVIVGGQLITNLFGFFTINGAAVTGLNEIAAPGSVGPNILYRSAFGLAYRIRWHSCYVEDSQEAMNAMSPIRSAWTDQWSLY